MDLNGIYPLVICCIAIAHGPVKIVSFPSEHGDLNHTYANIYQRVHYTSDQVVKHLGETTIYPGLPSTKNESCSMPLKSIEHLLIPMIPLVCCKIPIRLDLINSRQALQT